MFHHLGVFASDLAASRKFYEAALRPLGIIVGYETAEIAEFWREADDTPSMSLEQASAIPTTGLHVAFGAESRGHVDDFFQAATGAGGVERHPPRYWEEYSAYCAFVNDPDGNNVEAVHKEG